MQTGISLTATYGLVAIGVIATVGWLRSLRAGKVAMAIALVLGGVVRGALLLAAATMWNDPRPFVVDGLSPLLPHVPDNGFPSDHTVASSLVAGVVLGFHRRTGVVLLVLAVCVGAARVAAHLHHIPDVVAGLLIGIAAATLGTLLARFALGVAKQVPATSVGR